jgi:hypothetical protein
MQTQTTLETHGPALAKVAVLFLMLIPVFGFIICALGAWLMS